jgi:hypothetical protein
MSSSLAASVSLVHYTNLTDHNRKSLGPPSRSGKTSGKENYLNNLTGGVFLSPHPIQGLKRGLSYPNCSYQKCFGFQILLDWGVFAYT